MNRLYLIAAGAAISVLASCAADGGLAGKGKPIDKQASITATCDGIAKANAAFQTFAATRPGIIDANGMSVEATALETVGLHADYAPPLPPTPGSFCAKPYAGDLAVAETAAITALIKVTALLANWEK